MKQTTHSSKSFHQELKDDSQATIRIFSFCPAQAPEYEVVSGAGRLVRGLGGTCATWQLGGGQQEENKQISGVVSKSTGSS